MATNFQSPRYHLLTRHSPKQEGKNEGKWIFSSCSSVFTQKEVSCPETPLRFPWLTQNSPYTEYAKENGMAIWLNEAKGEQMPWGSTATCTKSEASTKKHKERMDVRQERKSLPQKSQLFPNHMRLRKVYPQGKCGILQGE